MTCSTATWSCTVTLRPADTKPRAAGSFMHTWYTAGARSTAAPCESTTVPSLRSDAAAALNAWKGRGVSA